MSRRETVLRAGGVVKMAITDEETLEQFHLRLTREQRRLEEELATARMRAEAAEQMRDIARASAAEARRYAYVFAVTCVVAWVLLAVEVAS